MGNGHFFKLLALYFLIIFTGCSSGSSSKPQVDEKLKDWLKDRQGQFKMVLDGRHLGFDYTKVRGVYTNMVGEHWSFQWNKMKEAIQDQLKTAGVYPQKEATLDLKITIYVGQAYGRKYIELEKGYNYKKYTYTEHISFNYSLNDKHLGSYNREMVSPDNEIYQDAASQVLSWVLPQKKWVYVTQDVRDQHFQDLMNAKSDPAKFKALLEKGHSPNASNWEGKVLLGTLIEQGNVERVLELLMKGADPNQKDINGENALQKALKMPKVSLVLLEALKKNKVVIAREDSRAMLVRAVGSGDMTLLDTALVLGADLKEPFIQTTGPLGGQPLSYLSLANSIETMKALLDKGADIHYKTPSGMNLLHVLTALSAYKSKEGYQKSARMAEYLIQKGLNPNEKDGEGNTVLHLLPLDIPATDFIEVLLKKGADSNVRNRAGVTPLFYALKAKNPQITEYLIGRTTDFTGKGPKGYGIVHEALDCKAPIHILNALLSKKTDFKEDDAKFPSLIFLLQKNQSAQDQQKILPLLELLIKKGAALNARDEKNGYTPLHYAKLFNLAKLLVEAGADVNALNKSSLPPIHYALYSSAPINDQIAWIKYLIGKGAKVDPPGGYQISTDLKPPHFEALFKELVAAKKIRITPDKGFLRRVMERYNTNNQLPPKIFRAKQLDELKYYISHGGNLKEEDTNKSRFFFEAVCTHYGNYGAYKAEQDLEMLNFLYRNGLEINKQNKKGDTALHYALETPVAELLLKYKADINAQNYAGETPLHKTIGIVVDQYHQGYQSYNAKKEEDFIKTALFLVARGADVKIANKKGQTPLLLLLSGKCRHEKTERLSDLLEAILKKGADANAGDTSGNTPIKLAGAIQDGKVREKYLALLKQYGAK